MAAQDDPLTSATAVTSATPAGAVVHPNPTPTVTAPTPPKDCENGGLYILGQALVFPRTEQGAWVVVAICTAIVALVYVVLHAPKEQLETVAGFILMKIDPNGKSKREPDTINYAFWTPSTETKRVLEELGDPPSDKSWVLASEVTNKTLNDFGEALRNANGVEGYRRAEVWGQGRKINEKTTPPIPGWWWTVRARKWFTIDDLSKLYTDHWQNKSALYVEVLDGAGAFK